MHDWHSRLKQAGFLFVQVPQPTLGFSGEDALRISKIPANVAPSILGPVESLPEPPVLAVP